MTRDEDVAAEINELWSPVYPYMVDHLVEAAGVCGGEVLDLGPFAGGMSVELLCRYDTFRATVHDETDGVLRWASVRAAARGVGKRLSIHRAPLVPLIWPDRSFDLVLVRGAFFFLTPPLLAEVGRVLRPGGFGWVGGGYGPRTPRDVIAPIGDLSRRLNDALGKRWVSAPEATSLVAAAGLSREARVSEDGGLWIEVRR